MNVFKYVWSKIVLAFQNMTFEPAVFVFFLATSMDDIPLQELLLYKVCINKFNYSEDICNDLKGDGNEDYNQEVQYEFSKYQIFRSAISSILPTLACLYLGAWCDSFGRKKLSILFWITRLMSAVQLQFNAYYRNGPPELFLLCEVPTSLIGGWAAYGVTMRAFISDITAPERRPFRFAVVSLFANLGDPIGTVSGTYIFEKYGIVACLTTSLVAQILGVLIMFWRLYKFKLKESEPFSCKKAFDPSLVKDSLKAFFKKRPGNARFVILTIVIATMFMSAPNSGERVIRYIFLRDRFDWGPQDIANYSATLDVWRLFVQLTLTPLMGLMTFSETKLTIFFCLFRVISDSLVVLAHEPWMFYGVSAIDALGRYTGFYISALFASCAPSEELGKVLAISSIFDNLNPIIFGPIYREFYQMTKDSLIGAPYLLSAASCLVAIFIFVYLDFSFKGKHLSEITGYVGVRAARKRSTVVSELAADKEEEAEVKMTQMMFEERFEQMTLTGKYMTTKF